MVNFAFLDSGIGGLPYLRYLKQKSKNVSCVYVADTKNFPYGEKSRKKIVESASECVKKIIQKFSPHCIIIACNTISVTALEYLRATFPNIPFVGTVPAIKPASLVSKNRKIGLLATNATVNHSYTKKLEEEFASDCEIISRGAPELIDFIEKNFFSATKQERLDAIKPFVDFFEKNGCDVICLSCTHFLNVIEDFKILCGDKISVIDSREGVIKHALEVEKKVKFPKSEIPQDSKLYITSVLQKETLKIYENFCEKNSIKFGGVF